MNEYEHRDENPFNRLHAEYQLIESKLDEIKDILMDNPEKYYTIKEASKLIKMSYGTILRHINKGTINALTDRYPIVIPHSSIYNENGELRKLRYKRKSSELEYKINEKA